MKKSTAKIYVILVNGKIEFTYVSPEFPAPKGKVIGKLNVAEFTGNERRYRDYFQDQLEKGAYGKFKQSSLETP